MSKILYLLDYEKEQKKGLSIEIYLDGRIVGSAKSMNISENRTIQKIQCHDGELYSPGPTTIDVSLTDVLARDNDLFYNNDTLNLKFNIKVSEDNVSTYINNFGISKWNLGDRLDIWGQAECCNSELVNIILEKERYERNSK